MPRLAAAFVRVAGEGPAPVVSGAPLGTLGSSFSWFLASLALSCAPAPAARPGIRPWAPSGSTSATFLRSAPGGALLLSVVDLSPRVALDALPERLKVVGNARASATAPAVWEQARPQGGILAVSTGIAHATCCLAAALTLCRRA